MLSTCFLKPNAITDTNPATEPTHLPPPFRLPQLAHLHPQPPHLWSRLHLFLHSQPVFPLGPDRRCTLESAKQGPASSKKEGKEGRGMSIT